MATRSRRFISQGSGIALAAFVVASMSVHDHRVVANAQNGGRADLLAVGDVKGTSVERHSQLPHVTTVDFGVFGPNVAHHY